MIAEWASDVDSPISSWAQEMNGAVVFDLGSFDLLPICGKTVMDVKRQVDRCPKSFQLMSENVIFCCPDAMLLHVTRCEDGVLVRCAILGEKETFFPPYAAVITLDWEQMRVEQWAFEDDREYSEKEKLECLSMLYYMLGRSFLGLSRQIKRQNGRKNWSFACSFELRNNPNGK